MTLAQYAPDSNLPVELFRFAGFSPAQLAPDSNQTEGEEFRLPGEYAIAVESGMFTTIAYSSGNAFFLNIGLVAEKRFIPAFVLTGVLHFTQ